MNSGLDALFIYVLDWGIQGAAWATVISYGVGSIWVLSHFFDSRSHIKFKKGIFKLEKEIVYSILSIGMSPFSMQLAASLVLVLVNSTLLHYGGDLAIGAYGIINSLIIMVVMVVLGLNQGTQPIVGYNFGAKQYDRMFKTLKISIIAATVLTTGGFLMGWLFPRFSVRFFTNDEELIQISTNALRLVTIFFSLIGFQIVISNFFQSIGKAKISIYLSMTRQFVFLIPLILLLPKFWGLNGAWLAMSFSDALSAIVAFFTLHRFNKTFKQKTAIGN